MKIDDTCRYTTTHEWVRLDGDEGTTGITDYAQEQLSDIVYVELPEIGDAFGQSDVYATVESVKAASDVYLPLGGEITEINEEWESSPELVNQDPFGVAWFVKFTASDVSEADGLMDAAGHEKFLEGAAAREAQ